MNANLINNTNAYNYLRYASTQFRAICNPLLELGISYFSYMKIFDDGSYLVLDTELNYRKVYLESIKNQGHFYTHIIFPKACKDKYQYHFFSDIKLFDRNKDPILHLLNDFNIRNNFVIYKLNDVGVYESYNFAMDSDTSYATTFYLNNLEVFEHFINYFNQNAQNLINTDDKKKLAKLDQTFNFHDYSEELIQAEKLKRFKDQTKLQNNYINGQYGQVKLSERELECLHYLSLGNTSKQIGNILNLSYRTVEFYLCNIKNKTGFSSKNLLITQFASRHALKII